MYAIIEDSGSQFKVSEGDVIDIDRRELPEDSATIAFDRVLLVGDGDDVKVGAPTLDGASVTADVLGEKAGEKLMIIKHRRRKDYHRRVGHRQKYLSVKITAIKA
ncbi:MAG: 50S ribosomal protein L21 [Planctomycetaceae bacterium]|nr:50S ribosomal protein L21 [Planctomycetaceae bacterium]